jgi:hypothetical protein
MSWAAGQDVLGRKIDTRILQLERARESGAVVVVGKAAERQQRLVIRERPAPTIEPDDVAKLGDRLALDRLTVQARLAEALESLTTAGPRALRSHGTSIRR